MRSQHLDIVGTALSIFAAMATNINPARAVDPAGCSLTVSGCLSRPAATRDLCFESASSSPACIGSLLGELAAKRSHFAPVAPQGAGPSFLGPQVIDRECLESFDRQLELALDLGPITLEQRRTLSALLDRCTAHAPSDLYRP